MAPAPKRPGSLNSPAPHRPGTMVHCLTVTCILLHALALAGGDAMERTEPAPRIDGMAELYAGPQVNGWDDLSAYSGEAAADRIVGEDRKRAYLLNYRQLGVNYGKGVDFQLRREQVILCPQTVEFLYGPFTPREVRYQRGSRPRLEEVVAKATAGCETDRAKMFALMRLCRDLYQRDPAADFAQYVYGGTEEQLIEKPEILCECLGRLMVALCEIAGLPGRIVMHDIGGHICSEILVDGQWAYVDPRCGLYFLKGDGSSASVWDLWQNPSIIRSQSDEVKADVSAQWTWPWRAWKCANMYFHPLEVNGFQNYSLADAGRYSYTQLPRRETLAAGLLDINKEYVAAARRVFGLSPDGTRHTWVAQKLRKLPIAYRHDGFSFFFREPPMSRQDLQQQMIDPLAESSVDILVWGLGPGSVFCYDTKVGQIFGEGLTEEQRNLLRTGDLHVHENVMGLIHQGADPLRVAIDRGHELGLRVFARLEMNHEYGPADPGNWLWVAFVGDLNKQHPEYRIGKSVQLDFRHREVRDFKLAIFREAAEAGADGVALDFAVYPPFFEEPDPAIMTQFMRDVRAALDEVGQAQARPVEIMARVPTVKYMDLGLDWKTWMREGLVDIIVPTHLRAPDYFDLRIEEFVSLSHQTGVPVYPTIWHSLGFVTTDQHPSDEKTGRRRYDKSKTKAMFYAQALMFHRAGADGLQLGMSADEWRKRPWFDDLADPEKVLHANKHYMVDPIELRPGTFDLPADGPPHVSERTVGLRIGDDIAAARDGGYDVTATLVVYVRPLQPGEKLEVVVNGNGPLTVSGDSAEEKARASEATIDPRKQRHDTFVFEREWWKRGEHRLPVEAGWWKLGENEIALRYSTETADIQPPLSITWVDLLLGYAK